MAIVVNSPAYPRSVRTKVINLCDGLLSDPITPQVRPITRLCARNATVALLCVTVPFFSLKGHSESTALVDNPTVIDEIVVTAQKRTSTIQTTPISITAVTGEDLLARGVASLAALAQGTPGVSLTKSDGDRDARHDLERRQLCDRRVLSR
jgi:hypothetical protein